MSGEAVAMGRAGDTKMIQRFLSLSIEIISREIMYCSYIFCGEALEGHQDIVESVDSIHHRSVFFFWYSTAPAPSQACKPGEVTNTLTEVLT